MSRMLQALRQIEAKGERSPQAGDLAPAETIAVESARQAFDRVEAALAAENLCPPGSPAALQLEPLPPLDGFVAEQTLAADDGIGVSPAVSAADPYAALAESIVAQWAAPGGENAATASAVLLFTSAGEGEGKSTTLARLAPELQRRVSGEVLVVDGSLRAAAPAARQNIHLSGRPIEALAGLRKRCRLVLVDAPSLRFSETAPLAACCDGTYLVVQLGATTRRALADAVAVIERNQGRLAGCVVVD